MPSCFRQLATSALLLTSLLASPVPSLAVPTDVRGPGGGQCHTYSGRIQVSYTDPNDPSQSITRYLADVGSGGFPDDNDYFDATATTEATAAMFSYNTCSALITCTSCASSLGTYLSVCNGGTAYFPRLTTEVTGSPALIDGVQCRSDAFSLNFANNQLSAKWGSGALYPVLLPPSYDSEFALTTSTTGDTTCGMYFVV